jgi:hypothetical protein
LHDVGGLIGTIISARSRRHDARIIANYDHLASSRIHLLIYDARQLGRHEPGAVDDDGRFPGVVHVGRLSDVLRDAAFADDAVLQALSQQPREVDGGIDTHGSEANARIVARWQVAWR